MESLRHRFVCGKTTAYPFYKIRFAQGKEKLLHVHWVHRVSIHLADGKNVLFTIDGYAEQTAGSNDMVFRSFLAEVLQGSDGALAELDLVKNDERISSGDCLTADMGQNRQQVGRADAFSKSCSKCLTGLKIEIGHIIIVLTPEFQDRIGFSHLTRSLNNQRLPVLTVFPLIEIVRDLSVHIHDDHPPQKLMRTHDSTDWKIVQYNMLKTQ